MEIHLFASMTTGHVSGQKVARFLEKVSVMTVFDMDTIAWSESTQTIVIPHFA
jgi:hypothetical protein